MQQAGSRWRVWEYSLKTCGWGDPSHGYKRRHSVLSMQMGSRRAGWVAWMSACQLARPVLEAPPPP